MLRAGSSAGQDETVMEATCPENPDSDRRLLPAPALIPSEQRQDWLEGGSSPVGWNCKCFVSLLQPYLFNNNNKKGLSPTGGRDQKLGCYWLTILLSLILFSIYNPLASVAVGGNELYLDSTVKCHSRWPNGFLRPLWSCSSGKTRLDLSRPTMISKRRCGQHGGLAKTLVVVVCSQSHYPSVWKLRENLYIKPRDLFLKSKIFVFKSISFY